MTCFIHGKKREAIATCIKCGKGMCDKCFWFFDTSGNPSSGACPTCRREDVETEKDNLERIRDDLWLKSEIACKKTIRSGWLVFFFALLIGATLIVLDLVAVLNILALAGIDVAFFSIGESVEFSLNTLISIIPIIIGIVVMLLIRKKAKGTKKDLDEQANAYEITRYELDVSLHAIDDALTKNRSNSRSL